MKTMKKIKKNIKETVFSHKIMKTILTNTTNTNSFDFNDGKLKNKKTK